MREVKYRIKMTVLAACLAAAAVLAAGCGPDSDKAAGSNRPDKPANSAASNIGQSAKPPASPDSNNASQNSNSPEEPDSADPVSQESYTIRTRLTNFQWMDVNTGYAWGTENSLLRLYRTEDGGDEWAPVTPEYKELRTGGAEPGRSIFFLDKNHGWISANRDGKPNLVLRTVNGGKSWQSTSLDKATFPAAIFFLDKQQGWLMTSSDAAMGSTEKTLYATKDGGMTWRAISSSPLPGSETKQVGSGLPLSGVTAGMSFDDTGHGWLTLISHAEIPILLKTENGGETWKESKLALPDKRKDNVMNFTRGPEFFPDDNKHGMMLVSGFEGELRVLDAYMTSNRGDSWTFRPFAMEKAITFADSGHGWGWRQNAIYRTLDSGKTWNRLITDSVLADKMKTYQEPLAMQFVTETTGWLLLGSTDGSKSLLLKSEDGGEHWAVQ